MRSIHTTKQENYNKNNTPYRVIHKHRTKLGNPIRGIILPVTSIIALSSMLLAGASTTYADSSVSLSIDNTDTVLELTLSESPVILNLTPSSTNNYTAFDSTELSVSAGTNNPTGYSLTMSVPNTNLTNSKVTIDSEHPIIPTLGSGTYTEDTFTTNTWGYNTSLDDNYLAIPSRLDFTPTESAGNATTTTLAFAAKVDASLPAGIYSTTLNFTLVANAAPVYEKEIIGLGTIQYDPGMTWGEWLESEYNTYNLETKQIYPIGENWGENIYSSSFNIFPRYIASIVEATAWPKNTDFIADKSQSDNYSGFCLWRLEGLGVGSASYNWFAPDQPIDFSFEYWDEHGQKVTMPTTYVYADYMRDTTAALFTEDYSFYTELSIQKTTTWSEWAAENPTFGLYDVEIADSTIIFTNSEDPNDKYILSDISLDDIIVGQEYFLTPAQ